MDLGSHFSAKLEPFLLMAKSVKGAAAAKLIQDATAAPGVFVFTELLELPNIQELGKSEQHAKYLTLLQIFSYGTYMDYTQAQDTLPALTPAQLTKLKHLSLVSLASHRRILPYADLTASLAMPSIRELEDLIIDAIYLDVLRGKLDQRAQQLEVEYTMGRDLAPGALEAVLEALTDWAATTSDVLATLDAKLAHTAAESAARAQAQAEHDRAVQLALKEAHDRTKDKALGATSSSNLGAGISRRQTLASDAMDVDEDPGAKGKNRKASQEAAPKQQRKRNRF
ncbi:hypothetical protein BD779DRAFT_1662842 [Infundibulicybe gibba]|nr:hypothetical protein BD779DRAFT_1662842 [Infundibulicybe gibba]